MKWQETIPDTEITVRGQTYIKPHKWIVCLIGQDVYSLTNFIENNSKTIKMQKNLNISVMGLSRDKFKPCVQPWRYESQYKELAELTKRGMYAKISDKQLADTNAETFF